MLALFIPTCAREAKPVIVITAFGTTVPKGQKDLESFDSMVVKRFTGYDIRWALTSSMVIERLRKAGKTTLFDRKVPVKSLDEVYSDLRLEGKTRVVVQSLHIMTGAEFNEMLSVPTKGLNVKYGYPLLFGDTKIEDIARALSTGFASGDTVTVLTAHGNAEHPEFNAPLVELDTFLRTHYNNVFLCTVEGPPGTDAFAKVKTSGVKKVHFMPFMIVAGTHIDNDVMSDDPASMKMQLGLPATCASGLGSNPQVMEFYIRSIEKTLSQLE
jgi:sirohydrochlorin cobaltochelatase